MSGHGCGRVAGNCTARGGHASASCRADQAGHRSPSSRVKAARARGVQAAPAAALTVLLLAALWPMGMVLAALPFSLRPPKHLLSFRRAASFAVALFLP